MSTKVDEVIARYVELRNEKKALEAEAELKVQTVKDKMEKIELWLLAKMAEDGTNSYRTDAGTAYKSEKASVTIADATIFKNFVFEPAVEALTTHLQATNGVVDPATVLLILQTSTRWDAVDFRAGKKGVQEFVEHHGRVPEGLNYTTFATIGVRKG